MNTIFNENVRQRGIVKITAKHAKSTNAISRIGS